MLSRRIGLSPRRGLRSRRFLAALVVVAGCLAGLTLAVQAQTTPPGFQILQHGDLPTNLYHGAVVVAEFDQRDLPPPGDGKDRMDVFMSGLRAPLSVFPESNAPFAAFYTHETEFVIEGPPPVVVDTLYTFNRIGGDFPRVFYSDASVIDYDGDSDLDLLFLGATSGGDPFDPVTMLYENSGGVNAQFDAVEAGFVGVHNGSADWGDFDHDGDPDLLLTGVAHDGYRTRLYRNLGDGRFEEIVPAIEDVGFGHAAWGDYDGDGDLDILLTGAIQPERFVSKVYRNDGGAFVEAGVPLPELAFSAAAWFDYDGDGRLDILLTGGFFNPFIMEGATRVFRNLGNGSFREIPVEGDGLFGGDLAVGDYDNDGDLDFVVSGRHRASQRPFTQMYRNEGDAFRVAYSIQQTVSSAFAFADFDYDGDLDLFITGFDPDASGLMPPRTQFYMNRQVPNAPPTTPAGLQAVTDDQTVTLTWDAASDDRTPSPGLTYNLRVGTFPGGSDVVAPMADVQTGQRWVSAPGNAGTTRQGRLTVPRGTYYWSVQALDGSYAASSFAPEQFFSTGDPNDRTPPSEPVAPAASAGDVHVVLAWQPNTEPDLSQYHLYRSTSPGASTFRASVDGRTSHYLDRDVSLGTTYYYRITALDESGNESAFSEEVQTTPAFVFTEIPIPMPDTEGVPAWGDYEGDGDLDLLLPNPDGRQQVWLGDATEGFVGIGIPFTDTQFFGLSDGAGAWGDYDNDGDLDVAVTGTQSFFGSPKSAIYLNTGDALEAVDGAGLLDATNASVAWSDYDLDGDLDLLLAGQTVIGDTTLLFRNEDGVLVDGQIGLPNLAGGSVAWGDYDNDGDPDALLAGNGVTRIFRNDPDTFRGVAAALPGVRGGGAAWGDYDNDGDLDVALFGSVGAGLVARVYQNTQGTFSEVEADMEGVADGAVAWGDYDNDGDLDLLLTGVGESGRLTRIYLNQRGIFLDAGITLTGLSSSSVAWGDYDNDSDLDLILTGRNAFGPATRLLRNDLDRINTPPSPPGALAAEVDGATATLQWSPASDAETPTPGLTYNLRVGTTPGGADVLSPMADLDSGRRWLPAPGNAFHTTARRVVGLPTGTYFWSVQAVDHSYAASSFAEEGTFSISDSNKSTDTETQPTLPRRPALRPNYPNPFRDRTVIGYTLPQAGEVRLAVYDVMGRRVRLLVNRLAPAGAQTVAWDGRGDGGGHVASGMYFYRLEVNGRPVSSRRLTLIH